MGPRRSFIKCRQKVFIEISKIRKDVFGCLRIVLIFVIFFAIAGLSMYEVIQLNNDPLAITKNFIYIEPLTSFYRFKHNTYGEKIDWHDYKLIDEETQRVGPGEHGKPFFVEPEEEELNKKIFDENGYNGLVSDKISLNRSVLDNRHSECRTKKYLRELPTVSVVIPFYNDHLSTLLRTVYSIINRSPPQLLKEIIMVNDRSTKKFLYGPLKDHIRKHLKHIVKLYELPVRSGLIWARLAGARAATGDILVFLDSHTEANTNWLPPLIEPIAEDYRVCVCPFIDVIDFRSFEYRTQDNGSRGMFDWNLNYQKIEAKPEHRKNPTDPFPSPVMAGGLFAISAKFFWELGGYDHGLDIWGGEQYELSFKIWLCGGKMYDAPCSRVGHVYRGGMPFEDDRKGIDFVSKNYKRVAEVWMDEYKEYVYKRNEEKYRKLDPGDLSKQFAIKKRNKCKPFSYFMEQVAPDMLERYPYVEPEPFAYGTIESVAYEGLCLDTIGHPDEFKPIGLYTCADNRQSPQDTQYFKLRYFRDIEITKMSLCFDSADKDINSFPCHNGQGNQYFRYDLDTQQIYHRSKRQHRCIDHDPNESKVFIAPCDEFSLTQKWMWGFVNETNLRNWLTYGSEIVDRKEIRDLKKIKRI